jgi:hypothetical protein
LIKIIEAYPEAAEYANDEGEFPLQLACSQENFDRIIFTIVDVNPNVLKKQNSVGGNNPLHELLWRRSDQYHNQIYLCMARNIKATQ